MKIIGAGFGRTGTLSVKAAIEMMGFGPCYHMMEAFEHPEHLNTWLAARNGQPVDWDAVFSGYRSTLDWPACDFWEPLAEKYPEAKIILTVRDPERWYESFHETLAPLWNPDSETSDAMAKEYRKYLELVQLITEKTFDGRLGDKEHVISVFERHNDHVRASVPADRLLVYEVKEGWQPLCDFLGTEAPEGKDFPHLNDRNSFLQMVKGRLGN
ncbi:sulfotransferase family protein [Streptomyces sp. NPDC054796]